MKRLETKNGKLSIFNICYERWKGVKISSGSSDNAVADIFAEVIDVSSQVFKYSLALPATHSHDSWNWNFV